MTLSHLLHQPVGRQPPPGWPPPSRAPPQRHLLQGLVVVGAGPCHARVMGWGTEKYRVARARA